MVVADRFDQAGAIQMRHHIIGQHQVRRHLRQNVQRLPAVRSMDDVMLRILEHRFSSHGNQEFVFHQ